MSTQTEYEIALKWLRDNEICGTETHERLTAEMLVRYTKWKALAASPAQPEKRDA